MLHTATHRPTNIPGEPVLPVGRGPCGKGITQFLEGKQKNLHDMRATGSSSCSSIALVLPSAYIQFSRWSCCIITEVRTQRPPPTMRSLAYLYLSLQSGTLMHVDCKVNTGQDVTENIITSRLMISFSMWR